MTVLISTACGGAEAFLGVDLTMLGAATGDSFPDVGATLSVEYASFPTLASCATAACSGGLDFITLSKSFRVRSDRQGTWLDAARTMARLTGMGAAGFCAEVPATAEDITAGVQLLAEQRDGWGSVEISLPDDAVTSIDDLAASAELARSRGVKFTVCVAARDVTDSLAEMIGSLADAVWLVTKDPSEARDVREKLQSIARALGRSLAVLVELGVVISGNLQAATERARLIEDMQGAPAFEGKARVVGTVYDVADAVEDWIGQGAADGVIFLPASLPTDLASIIRGVLPLLKARAIPEA